MSKQRKIQKIIFCILAVILVIVFYEAIGIYTAYKKQPKVSSETKIAVQEEIGIRLVRTQNEPRL